MILTPRAFTCRDEASGHTIGSPWLMPKTAIVEVLRTQEQARESCLFMRLSPSLPPSHAHGWEHERQLQLRPSRLRYILVALRGLSLFCQFLQSPE